MDSITGTSGMNNSGTNNSLVATMEGMSCLDLTSLTPSYPSYSYKSYI